MAFRLMATTQDNNVEGALSWTRPESCRSLAAHQLSRELLKLASQPSQKHHDHADNCNDVQGFYEQLESTIKAISSNDLPIIQGDWNAKVRPDAYEQWQGKVGIPWSMEKPMKGEKYFWNSHTGTGEYSFSSKAPPEEQRGNRPMASHTMRVTTFSHPGDSSPPSIEPRAEHSQEQILTANTTWLWWQWSWYWKKKFKNVRKRGPMDSGPTIGLTN